MRVTLNKDYYKGSDGSSLSDTRCEQMVLLYDMLKDIPNEFVTYKQIQDYATSKSLYGNAKADSVIRTYFPLLAKLGFVQYDDYIKTSDVFTNSGQQIVLLYRAMADAKVYNKHEVITRLYDVKAYLIQLGIKFWFNTESEKDNNIWLALDLFSQMRTVDWDEFLYSVYLWHRGENTSDIVSRIINNRNDGVEYEFFKEDGKPLPDTTYTYIRALLIEAHIIKNINSRTSVITQEGSNFISTIL